MSDTLTTAPEARTIAHVFDFDPRHADYIDWNKIAKTARGYHADGIDVRFADNGRVIITMFWTNGDERR
jgi:hypothetical protein